MSSKSDARAAFTAGWAVALLLGACSTDGEDVAGAARTTSHCPGPTIDTWYGDTPRPGLVGHPQRWVSILGNVWDADGVAALDYSLNGAPYVALPMGRDGLRLQQPGDFVLGIDRSTLTHGSHTVELRAEDGLGDACVRTVSLDYASGSVWPLPYSARFDTVTTPEEIETVAQVVDGRWEPTGTGLHIIEPGYDRLLAIGDLTWSPPYEARSTVTVVRLDTWGGIGLGVGWQGHEGTADPPSDWPIGGLGWVRNKTDASVLEIITFDQGTSASMPLTLTDGETYTFRIMAEPTSSTRMDVRVKVWNVADPEPPSWMLTANVLLRNGSVLLVAHAAEVIWRDFAADGPGSAVDAGVADGGAADGAAGDAGASDAGTTDAGPADAGTHDAGAEQEDGGTRDAGAEDAGEPGSGVEDAGVEDAGEPDSGADEVDSPPRRGRPSDAGSRRNFKARSAAMLSGESGCVAAGGRPITPFVGLFVLLALTLRRGPSLPRYSSG